MLRDRSGSTCTAVLVTPTHYVFSNLGDSRAVLAHGSKACIHAPPIASDSTIHCSPSLQVVYATKDHKPSLAVERNRIKAAGGMVMNERVDGGLAVSRAFGDFDYKMRRVPFTQWMIS